MKLLGNLKKGQLFVLSAPAGTGKTTLVSLLTEEFPCVVASISYTTRPPRSGEIPGVHYHFVSRQEFENKILHDELLEYAKIYGNYYGTARENVLDLQNEGKHVFLVIDTQGALQLKGKVPAVFIFVQPPSIETLQGRLTSRSTETNSVIAERLRWAKKELLLISQYDYCIVNDDLSTAYQVLRSIVIAEEHRTKNQGEQT